MEKYKQDEFIEFDYNGETLYCRITDNNEPIRIVLGVEKMSRFANFYISDKSPIVTGWAEYGTVVEMTNITSFTVKKRYEDIEKAAVYCRVLGTTTHKELRQIMLRK